MARLVEMPDHSLHGLVLLFDLVLHRLDQGVRTSLVLRRLLVDGGCEGFTYGDHSLPTSFGSSCENSLKSIAS